MQVINVADWWISTGNKTVTNLADFSDPTGPDHSEKPDEIPETKTARRWCETRVVILRSFSPIRLSDKSRARALTAEWPK